MGDSFSTQLCETTGQVLYGKVVCFSEVNSHCFPPASPNIGVVRIIGSPKKVLRLLIFFDTKSFDSEEVSMDKNVQRIILHTHAKESKQKKSIL